MGVASEIERKLTAALTPVRLEIIDESAQHAGHAAAPEGGESHFRVTIVADAFDGLNRVARQRRIYELLTDEFAAGLHALSITARTPGEDHN